jgi:hypothetical protein
VLSACETQLGVLTGGDDVVGLTRAFIYAGTPSVVASLWKVPDEETRLFMESFYEALQGGRTKAEAIQVAQQTVREKRPSPYYWAGFALTGDPGSIAVPLGNVDPSGGSSWRRPLIAGAAALIVVAGAGALMFRRRVDKGPASGSG